jgi:hypothetical protein
MLLILVSACGLGGWIAHVADQARVQRQAVAAIERSGGFVSYDRQRRGAAPPRGESRWPRWLEARIGIDQHGDVVGASFVQLSAAELELVGRLPRLEDLEVYHSSVTDAGLAHLRGLTRLKELDLSDWEITDAGLVHLAGLTGLQKLDLSRTPITDAGLVHLAGLTSLQDLDLANTGVSNAGVAHLKRLTNLRSLDLLFTEVDDFGVQELRRALPKVKVRFRSIMAR